MASCLTVVSLGFSGSSCKVWQSFHAEAQKRETPRGRREPISETDGDRWSTALEGTLAIRVKTNKNHYSLLQCRVGFPRNPRKCKRAVFCRVG